MKKPEAIIFLCMFMSAALSSRSRAQTQSCRSESFSSNRLYASCNSLPYLGASLHWNYHPSNRTAAVAFRAPQSASGWVAWAINPSGAGMIGANAFLAFPAASGGSGVTVYTTKFSGYGLQVSDVKDEDLDFQVFDKQAEYSGGRYTIYATLALPGNRTTVNTVWQASTEFQSGVPYGHGSGDNELSKSSVDFLSGEAVAAAAAAAAAASSRVRRKNIHGILNAISWGILMPVGAIIARYVKVFKAADPAWFYLHVTCQFSAYVIGVAGWGLGLKLGSESVGITYHKHRDIAIALFCFATLQVFALLLRPNKEHKHRIYWNVYHHSIGYSIIILSVVNIFKGFDILEPAKKWKHAYTGIVATLAAVALVLEVITWAIVLKRRSRSSSGKSHHGDNGANSYVFSHNQLV